MWLKNLSCIVICLNFKVFFLHVLHLCKYFSTCECLYLRVPLVNMFSLWTYICYWISFSKLWTSTNAWTWLHTDTKILNVSDEMCVYLSLCMWINVCTTVFINLCMSANTLAQGSICINEKRKQQLALFASLVLLQM